MALAHELLLDAFARVHDELPGLVDGLTVPELLWQPDPDANSIGWLLWHLSRVQDDHLAGIGEVDQVWTVEGYAARFGLPYDVSDHGFGHTRADVAGFRIDDPGLLVAYHDEVHNLTEYVVGRLDDAGFARVVDHRWNPPVTAAVRLVSVVNDVTQHLGQAAYLRGMVERGRPV
jgi:hypothetical protein